MSSGHCDVCGHGVSAEPVGRACRPRSTRPCRTVPWQRRRDVRSMSPTCRSVPIPSASSSFPDTHHCRRLGRCSPERFVPYTLHCTCDTGCCCVNCCNRRRRERACGSRCTGSCPTCCRGSHKTSATCARGCTGRCPADFVVAGVLVHIENVVGVVRILVSQFQNIPRVRVGRHVGKPRVVVDDLM